MEDSAVLVRGSRIEKTGKIGDFPTPLGCTEIDGTQCFLLPGFIDAHTHIMQSGSPFKNTLHDPFSLEFFLAARNLHDTLMAGVLTVRDAGGADLGVREAVDQKIVFGPDIRIAVTPLSPTGGAADGQTRSGQLREPWLPHPGRPRGVADGVGEVRRKVRELIRVGADWIKVHVTGLPSPDGVSAGPLYTADELAAAVEEASLQGVRVMAFANGAQGVLTAAEAGVASLELGVGLDEKASRIMADTGTFYVPMLGVSRQAVDRAREEGSRGALERAEAVMDAHLKGVKRAIEAGVRIVLGSNGGPTPHGTGLGELARLVEAGLTPAQAVSAGTVHASDLLGEKDRLGAVAAGMRADLLLTRKNPLEDIHSLADPENLAFIMKEGEVIHSAL